MEGERTLVNDTGRPSATLNVPFTSLPANVSFEQSSSPTMSPCDRDRAQSRAAELPVADADKLAVGAWFEDPVDRPCDVERALAFQRAHGVAHHPRGGTALRRSRRARCQQRTDERRCNTVREASRSCSRMQSECWLLYARCRRRLAKARSWFGPPRTASRSRGRTVHRSSLLK